MLARKDEILIKRARLAELKRQRELRQKEFSQSRASIGDASEVTQASIIRLLSFYFIDTKETDHFPYSKSGRQQSRAR
jgi:hypothetical protein